MGRKKFEDVEYDPFQEEARRNLARQVSNGGRTSSREQPASGADSKIVSSKATRYVPRENLKDIDVPQKSRTFKCSSSTQDKELDAFLSRIGEVAGTVVPFQVITRAALAATMRSEEQIVDLLKKRPSMRRPANVSATEYAQFEQFWTEIVIEALRKLRPYQ